MTDITTLLSNGSARAIGEAIAAGQITSYAATQWYLARIAQISGGESGLNCVRTRSRMALEEAQRADEARARPGA